MVPNRLGVLLLAGDAVAVAIKLAAITGFSDPDRVGSCCADGCAVRVVDRSAITGPGATGVAGRRCWCDWCDWCCCDRCRCIDVDRRSRCDDLRWCGGSAGCGWCRHHYRRRTLRGLCHRWQRSCCHGPGYGGSGLGVTDRADQSAATTEQDQAPHADASQGELAAADHRVTVTAGGVIVSAGGVTTTGAAGTVVVATGGVTVTVGAGDGLPVTVVVGAGSWSGAVIPTPATQPTKAANSPSAMVPRTKPLRRGRAGGTGWDMPLRCALLFY
jgi:hypothetical protein